MVPASSVSLQHRAPFDYRYRLGSPTLQSEFMESPPPIHEFASAMNGQVIPKWKSCQPCRRDSFDRNRHVSPRR